MCIGLQSPLISGVAEDLLSKPSIGILLPRLKPPYGSRPQRPSHSRIPVFASPRFFRRAGPVPVNLCLLCPCVLHALGQDLRGLMELQCARLRFGTLAAGMLS